MVTEAPAAWSATTKLDTASRKGLVRSFTDVLVGYRDTHCDPLSSLVETLTGAGVVLVVGVRVVCVVVIVRCLDGCHAGVAVANLLR